MARVWAPRSSRTVQRPGRIFIAHAAANWTMRGPTAALLWEICGSTDRRRRDRRLTVMGRLIGVLETGAAPAALARAVATHNPARHAGVPAPLCRLNCTESSGGRGVGQFPRRLFTLPVTRCVSLRFCAGGITSIQLLYLLWMEPLSRGGSASVPFVAVLLAAFVVFYLWALWTLERTGSLRLVMLGVIAVAVFAIGVLPSFPPTPPPSWRSEAALAGLVAGLASLRFC